MLSGLLEYSIERLDSLKHFYLLEKKSIDNRAKKGMEINRLGYTINKYFTLAVLEENQKDDKFKKLEDCVQKEVEILTIGAKNDRGYAQFRYKDPEKLKGEGKELDIHKATTAFHQYADMPIIHGSNTLIMLITRFEEFISALLKFIYEKYPEKYLDKQTVTFSEIVKAGIEEARQHIVFREVDVAMRKNQDEWFSILTSHGMKFDKFEDELSQLDEIYARRNIWVHNSGEANDIYLKTVKEATVKKGDMLFINEEYLLKAFETIKTIIFAIMVESVKISNGDKTQNLYDIFELAFEELKQENYSICKKVFALISESKFSDSQIILMSKVNAWIAKGELDGYDKIEDEVKSFDVQTLQGIYSLAKHLLLQDFDSALRIIEDLYEKNELPSSALKEWPLFKRFRETEQYNTFRENHPDFKGVRSFESDVKEQDDSADNNTKCEKCEEKHDQL